jgi:naphthoate synthase/2-ketocyclohexanecarboxyl-CoA hydrolase
MWMLCRRYPAQQAYEMGLVNKVVPRAELADAVDAWCAELLLASPGCLEILKAAFDQEMDGYAELGVISSQFYPDWFDMPEGQEGAAAFTERRKPAYWAIRKREREARDRVLAEHAQTKPKGKA